MLVEMPFGPFPMALGVLYDDPRPTFESAVIEQNAKASEGKRRRPRQAARQGPDLDGHAERRPIRSELTRGAARLAGERHFPTSPRFAFLHAVTESGRRPGELGKAWQGFAESHADGP